MFHKIHKRLSTSLTEQTAGAAQDERKRRGVSNSSDCAMEGRSNKKIKTDMECHTSENNESEEENEEILEMRTRKREKYAYYYINEGYSYVML